MCWAIPKSPMTLPWQAETGENGSITNCLRRCLSTSAKVLSYYNMAKILGGTHSICVFSSPYVHKKAPNTVVSGVEDPDGAWR